MKKTLRIFLLITGIMLVSSLQTSSALADSVVATIGVGDGPFAVAANPLTHRVYVANYNTNTMSVINSATDSWVTDINISGGSPYPPYPVAVAINPNTNKIYVLNFWNGMLVVVNGQTNAVETSISVGASHGSLRALAVNPETNKIYVTNLGSSVYAIDGSTNSVEATITVGEYPRSIAVNSTLKRLYVVNTNSNSVSVIDINPVSPTYNSVVATPLVGTEPYAIGLNVSTGKVYVANRASNDVSVINSSNTVDATIPVGLYPYSLAVNTQTNKIYVANRDGGTVSDINGATNSVSNTVTVGSGPVAVACIDTTGGKVYVANNLGNTVTAIDPANSNSTQTLTVGTGPASLAIDTLFAKPKVYAANYGDDTVSVIDPPTAVGGSLITNINPMPGSFTASTIPLLSGTSANYRSPYNSNIMKVAYQLDGFDGQWTDAVITSGAGTPSVSWEAAISEPLSYGTHTIYAVGLDMTAATVSSTNGNVSNSISTGAVATYTFQVVPANTIFVNDISFIYIGKIGTGQHQFEGLEFTIHIKDAVGNDIPDAIVYCDLAVPTGQIVPKWASTGIDGKARFGYYLPKSIPTGTYTVTVTNVTKDGCIYDSSLNVETQDQYVHVSKGKKGR